MCLSKSFLNLEILGQRGQANWELSIFMGSICKTNVKKQFQFFRQIMLYSFLDLQEFKTQSPCSCSVIICSNLICGISLHFFCMCLTQLLLVLKLVLQLGQLNGFSPVWILIWVTISRLDFIAFGHIGQMYWLSTFKGTICICNESREERTSRIQIMIYSGMLQVKKALGVDTILYNNFLVNQSKVPFATTFRRESSRTFWAWVGLFSSVGSHMLIRNSWRSCNLITKRASVFLRA